MTATIGTTRVSVQLRDHRVLRSLMENKQISVRSLTDDVNRQLRRHKARRVEKSTIGNLRSGAAKNTRPDVAQAISECLQLPRDVLFIDKVSNYTSGIGR